jgi:hypothetical protein
VRAKDTESKPEQDRPQIEKEKLRDLDLGQEAEEVRGGAPRTGPDCLQAGSSACTACHCGS